MMIVIWLVQSLVRLINYPILGKLIGVSKVHNLNPIFISLHGVSITFWLLSSNSLFNMVLLLLITSMLQLLIMIFLILKNYKELP